MSDRAQLRLQLVVFALVSAAFTNIYITQPVLPVLQQEFAVSSVVVSFTISAVVLGIAVSNLPFGVLADRLPIQPLILVGSLCVALGGLICVLTDDIHVLIAGRFLQGLFVPALTTCVAAFLAKTLPLERLNVVMGYYVSATVVGGLGGRLLGGWLHPPLHWRYAFISAGIFLLVAMVLALRTLPRQPVSPRSAVAVSFVQLLRRHDLILLFLCGAGGFAIFSSVFNFLPFRLSEPLFGFSTGQITLMYLVYVMGIFMGPMAGRIGNRVGSGRTLLLGAGVLGLALLCLLLPSAWAIGMGLLLVCAGFFTVHAAAVGAINRKLTGGQGRANALYVLFYYVGGWLGITVAGLAYTHGGWLTLVVLALSWLVLPVMAGMRERRVSSHPSIRHGQH